MLAAGAKPAARSLPPGAQHLLTIEGQNTVSFVPQAGMNPSKLDYQARVEYIVNTRSVIEADAKGGASVKKKTGRRSTGTAGRTRKSEDAEARPKVAGAVDVSVHSAEIRFQQNGQAVVESRISRARFQGRLQPNAPILRVSFNEAPPALQEMLKRFDTPAASVLLDDQSHVLDRRVRLDGPLHALVETLLSIHTPIPRDVGFWEAPTQLAMGHGQTAKGNLRFEKEKESVAKTGGLVKVKVSGVLTAEGVVVGRLIKDGTYTVTGEQHYDPRSRQWKSARWSVAVANELANADGVTIAHSRGTMLVQSEALDQAPAKDVDAPSTKSEQGSKPSDTADPDSR